MVSEVKIVLMIIPSISLHQGFWVWLLALSTALFAAVLSLGHQVAHNQDHWHVVLLLASFLLLGGALLLGWAIRMAWIHTWLYVLLIKVARSILHLISSSFTYGLQLLWRTMLDGTKLLMMITLSNRPIHNMSTSYWGRTQHLVLHPVVAWHGYYSCVV